MFWPNILARTLNTGFFFSGNLLYLKSEINSHTICFAAVPFQRDFCIFKPCTKTS